MTQNLSITAQLDRLNGRRFNTAVLPEKQRAEWLREIIGREYANVEITRSEEMPLYNDMFIYPLKNRMRFSPIQSNAIDLERLPQEPTDISHDSYFAVLLLSGSYKLEQGGREVFLKPGEMTLYDATEPHRITIPTPFSKLLISIPRHLYDAQISNINNLTACKLANASTPSVQMLKRINNNLPEFDRKGFESLSQVILESIETTLLDNGARHRNISSFKALSLLHVKQFINTHLDDDSLDAEHISHAVRLSVRTSMSFLTRADFYHALCHA